MKRVGRVVGTMLVSVGHPRSDRLSQPSHPDRLPRNMSCVTIPDSWKSEFELPTNKEVGATSLTEQLRATIPRHSSGASAAECVSDVACLQNQNRVYISVGTPWDFSQSDRGSW